MMKCPVCGTVYSEDPCPLCGYEDLFIVGASAEESRREIQQRIERLKQEFRRTIRLGIVVYQYEADEQSVRVSEERVLFPASSSVDGKLHWMSRKFGAVAELPERETVELTLFAEIAGKSGEFRQRVSIRNFPGEETRKIGIRVDDHWQFTLCLRGDSGRQTESSPQNLFAG